MGILIKYQKKHLSRFYFQIISQNIKFKLSLFVICTGTHGEHSTCLLAGSHKYKEGTQTIYITIFAGEGGYGEQSILCNI
jgi:hypothetical protein